MSNKNKVVIIMGASSGIGAATAAMLAQQGAKLSLAARRLDRLQEIQAQYPEAEIEIFKADVTNEDEVQAVIDGTVAKFGRIDVLFNNAGIMPVNNLNQVAQNEWQQMLDINVKGVLNGIGSALPIMRKQQSGHIITTSSVLGYEVLPGYAAYSGTKYAVRAIMEGLRQEEHQNNIKTTVIAPGTVKTELFNSINNEKIRNELKDAQKLPGAEMTGLDPKEIAQAVAFVIDTPANMAVNEMVIRPTGQTV
ncbi:SDR family oxidoreductase [Pediococcus pentosaceus]|jgi:NADP-dependent 3-hydroxy acid dehydrogenase YdfG|uniref:SDR family oxidoreductase n=1 Tax=Pediococcus pentosaceus TaxID=1255 RepID=A0ABD7X8H4_PEDPE|nr:SDR family oxidoreductase [Pediococcus pentosaceus]AXR42733.1 oxidoreductase [Pediococcus pentosaceus]KAF0519233.1 SDR family NAD(P)-dependent oxidoreductase [Pediococcus pentosaceus]MBF7111397.1 SDR family oxidoreductase [Pediococcus pentosaceus]MBF7116630.1 SDR family oxidoreductase [Pediococcus pentosaceus]MBF7118370.1 SDR family oxidoreductase [Pediococcus pentosaceus]